MNTFLLPAFELWVQEQHRKNPPERCAIQCGVFGKPGACTLRWKARHRRFTSSTTPMFDIIPEHRVDPLSDVRDALLLQVPDSTPIVFVARAAGRQSDGLPILRVEHFMVLGWCHDPVTD